MLNNILSFCKRHHVWGKIFFFGVLLLYWFIFNYCDPFGAKSGTEDGSKRVFHALSTPVYGIGSSETHNHVAVVTVNDQSFQDDHSVFYGQRWPLSYVVQNSLIRKILNSDPAAVFVDVRFMNESSNQTGDFNLEQAFNPIIKLAHDKKIPIFFARGDSDDETMRKLGNKQGHLPPPLREYEVFSNGSNGTNHYPLLQKVEGKSGTQEKAGEEQESVTGGGRFLNPALALYDALCTGGSWHSLKECAHFRVKDYKDSLIVKWGLLPDHNQRFVSFISPDMQDLYKEIEESSWQRSYVEFERALMAMSAKLTFFVRPRVRDLEKKGFYPLTIPAQSLFCSTKGGAPCETVGYDEARKENAPKNSSIQKYLKGRVVFYGTDLRDEHDDEDIDSIGHVPGVMVHAMAFDNLMTYGRKYYHVYDKSVGWITVLKLFNLGVWAILSGFIVWGGKKQHNPKNKQTDSKDQKPAPESEVLQSHLDVWVKWVGGRLPGKWKSQLDEYKGGTFSLRRLIRYGIPLFLFVGLGIIGCLLGDRIEGALFLGFVVASAFFLYFTVGKGYVLNIMQVAGFEAIIFQFNSAYLHWGNTDWLSLAVLWSAAQSGELAEKIHSCIKKSLFFLASVIMEVKVILEALIGKKAD